MKYALLIVLIGALKVSVAQDVIVVHDGDDRRLYHGFSNEIIVVDKGVYGTDYTVECVRCEILPVDSIRKPDYFSIRPAEMVKEAKLLIHMKDGTTHTHLFYVSVLPSPLLFVDGKSNGEEIYAPAMDETISLDAGYEKDLKFHGKDFYVKSWDLKYTFKGKEEHAAGSGRFIPARHVDRIKQLKDGETVTVTSKVDCSDGIARLLTATIIVRQK